MKILFLDCKNGISGDMLLRALGELSGSREEYVKKVRGDYVKQVKGFHAKQGEEPEDAHKESVEHHKESVEHHKESHNHHHHHGRSFDQVKAIIGESPFSPKAKAYAQSIYQNIAQAEAEVHRETLETIHFHEVGRDEAISNALGIGAAIEAIDPDEIIVSAIYDGKGFVDCSHGRIPVPVPAVKALMKRSSFDFKTADVETEMVTPSGLAAIMGIGARNIAEFRDEGWSTEEAAKAPPGYKIINQTEAKGNRNTGRGGLKAYIIEV